MTCLLYYYIIRLPIFKIHNTMARKKDIAKLVSALAGNEPAILPSEDEQGNLPTETAEALHIDSDLEEKLNKVRRAKVGRPRKFTEREIRERENRATFIVSKELVRKVKYISLKDSKLVKDVVAAALSEYITKWETANGIINL